MCSLNIVLAAAEMSSNDKMKNGAGGNEEDGKGFQLKNPHLLNMENDFLYHLNLGTETQDLKKMFGDVKFVCMGGTNQRMEDFANFIKEEINYELPPGATLLDISKDSHRFCLYKVGPVISVSHGMGISSVSILLHEMIKLMHHAQCVDPIFIRIGTCGGIGVKPGTVIVTDQPVDPMLRTVYEIPILGKLVKRESILDNNLAQDLKSQSEPGDDFETVLGKTMAASDFYEEQGRVDGAFCDFEEEDKFKFLNHLYANGVRNIEMEAIPFGALTHQAGIKSAIVCVALINRLDGDQVTTPKDDINEWQYRPQKIVARFIKNRLSLRMNVSLTFEVLLYLNSYYFGLFAICEIGMNVVKALNQPMPSFGTDFGILLAVCVLELFRVIIARKGNLTEKWWPVCIALLFTIPSAIGVVYFLMWQSFAIRFEYIICAIQLALQVAEIFFGVLVLLPVCKTPEYY